MDKTSSHHPCGIGCGNGDDRRTRQNPKTTDRKFCCSLACCVKGKNTQVLRCVEEIEKAREGLVNKYLLVLEDSESIDKPQSESSAVEQNDSIESGGIAVEISAQDQKDFVMILQKEKQTTMASWYVKEHGICWSTYLDRLEMIVKPCVDGEHKNELEKGRWLHVMSPETYEPPELRDGRGYDIPIVVGLCRCNRRREEKSLKDMVQEGIEKTNLLSRGVITVPKGGL